MTPALLAAQKQLAAFGASVSDQALKDAAAQLGYATHSVLGKPSDYLARSTVGRECDLYRAYLTRSQRDPKIEASLKAKCDAASFARSRTGGESTGLAVGATPLDPIVEAPSGTSPVLIGAIALGVGVVGFLALRSMRKKKR